MDADTVSKYLSDDHRRLDSVLRGVATLFGGGLFDDAARCFAEFEAGLDRHINAEEQVLFPAFEEMSGMQSGPTAVMREEHIEIRSRMRELANAIESRTVAAAAAAHEELGRTLYDHNMKEEQVLYPMADRALGTVAARAALVRDMAAL